MTNEEAVNVLRNTCLIVGRINGKTVFAEALNMAIMALETQPEIIRCKDCKHFMEYRDEKYECECGRLNMPEPDDFCSRPKQKENI